MGSQGDTASRVEVLVTSACDDRRELAGLLGPFYRQRVLYIPCPYALTGVVGTFNLRMVLGDESEKNTILKAKARQVEPEAHGLSTGGYPGFALALSELDPLGQRFVAELTGNAEAPMSVMGAVHGQDPILCHVEFRTLAEQAPAEDDEFSFMDELEQLDSADDYGDEQTIVTGDFDMEDFLVNPEGEPASSVELDLPAVPTQVPANRPPPTQRPVPTPPPALAHTPMPGQMPFPTPPPALAHTPMPGQMPFPTPPPGQVHTPMPGQVHTPMPGQVHTPMPGQVHTPMPGQVHTPMPGQVHTPMPGQVHTPMPGQVHTPMPGQVHTPMPGQVHTPMPGQVHTPMPSYPGMPVPTPYPESQGDPNYPANNPNYNSGPFADQTNHVNTGTAFVQAGRRKNRTAIIAVGIAAIALALGAVYFFFLAPNDGDQVASNSNPDAGVIVQDSGIQAPTADAAPIANAVDASVEVAVEPDLDAAPESLCQVSITTEPEGAALFYLGTNLGVTPYKGPIDCMAKVVDIRHPQYESNQAKFEFVDGVGSAALVQLSRPSFWVTINSVPDNASLKIDGEFIGKTPFSFPLPGFEWTSITISRKGFASEIIDILPTEPKSAINLKLKR